MKNFKPLQELITYRGANEQAKAILPDTCIRYKRRCRKETVVLYDSRKGRPYVWSIYGKQELWNINGLWI